MFGPAPLHGKNKQKIAAETPCYARCQRSVDLGPNPLPPSSVNHTFTGVTETNVLKLVP